MNNAVLANSPSRIMRMRRFYATYSRILVPFIIAAMLIIAGEFVAPGFAGANHVLQLLKTSALLGVLVLAQSVVIISGGEGIDLSVGAIASFSAIMAAVIMNGKDADLVQATLLTLRVWTPSNSAVISFAPTPYRAIPDLVRVRMNKLITMITTHTKIMLG